MANHFPPPSESDSSEDETLEHLRETLASSDPAIVIANHCYGLFELAAVYLGEQPPRLPEAQFAIDALAGLLGASSERLGEAATLITEGLTQLRLAWVQIKAAHDSAS